MVSFLALHEICENVPRVAASDIYLLFCKLLIKFIDGAFNNTFGFVISLFF